MIFTEKVIKYIKSSHANDNIDKTHIRTNDHITIERLQVLKDCLLGFSVKSRPYLFFKLWLISLHDQIYNTIEIKLSNIEKINNNTKYIINTICQQIMRYGCGSFARQTIIRWGSFFLHYY